MPKIQHDCLFIGPIVDLRLDLLGIWEWLRDLSRPDFCLKMQCCSAVWRCSGTPQWLQVGQHTSGSWKRIGPTGRPTLSLRPWSLVESWQNWFNLDQVLLRCRVHGPHLGRDAASETDKSTSRHRWLLCKVVCSVCTQAGWTMQLWLQQTRNDKAHESIKHVSDRPEACFRLWGSSTSNILLPWDKSLDEVLIIFMI